MVPQTYPSILNPYTNRHEMVVKQLASTSGLQRWTDYIPVKLSASTRPAGEQTTDGDGFIAINTSQNTSAGVAFKDWVPVYFDNDATDAWVVSASGYIPIGASGGAIAILKSFGSNAHVYLPGANGVAVSGLPTNNYTLSDGSTGYSAVDGTAGLVLDGVGAVGAELFTGAFTRYNTVESDTTTVPALCTSTGVFSVVGISKLATANMPYRCTFTWSGNTTGRSIQFGGGTGIATLGTAVSGSATFTVVPSIGNMYIYFSSSAAGQAVSFDSFSAKPISGIHATQATTANKPALRRGLLNVLKQSNTFTDANWLKTNIAPTAGVADPFGGTAATTLTATAASGEIYQTAADAGKPYTSGIYIRRRTGSGAVNIRNAANTAWIPLSLTSAWQLLVNDGGTTTANWYLDLQISTSGDAVDVYGAIVSPGVLSAQQILAEGGIPLTTSAAASNPSAGRYWWQSDGTNDSLYSSVAPFNQNDDWFMCSAFRVDNVSLLRGVQHVTVDGTSRGPKFMVRQTTGYAELEMYDGTNWVNLTDTVNCVGQVVVLWATQVAGVRKLWKNGTLVGSNSTVLTPVTCVGHRMGALTTAGGSPLNGMLGPQEAIKGTFSDADALTLARMVASNTPNAPVF